MFGCGLVSADLAAGSEAALQNLLDSGQADAIIRQELGAEGRLYEEVSVRIPSWCVTSGPS